MLAASRSSVLTSPPSRSSASSSADSTSLSFLDASPLCELCASSAITAKRLPSVAASFRTAWRIRNASLTTFVFDGKGRVTLDGFNALPHLPDPSTWTFR